MGDFLFVARMIVATVVLMLLMQIKIGDHTLEEKSLAWIHQSSAAENLRAVAAGALRALTTGYNSAASLIEDKTTLTIPKVGISEDASK